MKSKQWFYWIGMLIVVGTHVYMLVFGLPENQMMGHALLNLVAAVLIGAAWFQNEKCCNEKDSVKETETAEPTEESSSM